MNGQTHKFYVYGYGYGDCRGHPGAPPIRYYTYAHSILSGSTEGRYVLVCLLNRVLNASTPKADERGYSLVGAVACRPRLQLELRDFNVGSANGRRRRVALNLTLAPVVRANGFSPRIRQSSDR